MLWVYLLLVSIQQNEGTAPQASTVCQGTGQPCIEFIKNARSYCSDDGDIRQRDEDRSILDDEESEYPWWIEKGSARKLCCDIKVSEPMVIDTLQLQWYYYEKLSSFGADGFTILKNDTHYTVEETKRPGSENNRAVGRLEINEPAYSSSGAYACQVVVNTTTPDGYNPLEIGRISEPFVINVYSDSLAFEDENYQRNVDLGDYSTDPYAFIRYKLQPVNPNKKLLMSIETDESFFQYINIRDRSAILITPRGNLQQSEKSFQKDFTVNFFYEDGEENMVSRTWTIAGEAYTPLAANSVITVNEEDPEEGGVGLGNVFPKYVLGSCERFRYKVEIDGGNEIELEFDGTFPTTFQSITDGNVTLEYKFTNKMSSGDLAKTNAYVELILSRNDNFIDDFNQNTGLEIFVSCHNVGAEDTQLPPSLNFLGLPYFPSDPEADSGSQRNCLSYNQTSPPGYYGSEAVGQPVAQRLCCQTQGNLYPNVYLWQNGKKLLSADYTIVPLYDNKDGNQAYPWFDDNAGYYQCIVGKYQYEVGSGPAKDAVPFYTMIKARSYKIGFDIGSHFKASLDIDLSQSTSFLLKSEEETKYDVSKYNIQLGKELLVVNGSCVGLPVQGVTFPQSTIAWEAQGLDLFHDKACMKKQDPATDADNKIPNIPNISYTYDPYSKVKIQWRLYAGRAEESSDTYSVQVSLHKAATTSVSIFAKAPYLHTPDIAQHPIGDSLTCTVAGYPLDSVTLYSIDKNSDTVGTVLQRFELSSATAVTLRGVENRDGYKVVLQIELGNTDGVKKVRCIAVNSLLSPESEKHTDFDVNVTAKTDVMVIVAAAIGIVMLVLVVWIVCAFVRMGRHPSIKFGEAICCRTGPYSKVTKIPMDVYKLEYRTLNPSTTLGGGHFGIVRRGFCSLLPDRQGERIEIAIKEVKPCIDRSRREDDLRRERDLMMRLRSHRNVLRIYGYTDEPDQLALVLEFAPFGSLDKLLVVARTIKTDGYMMPNEQINNPIEAFESKHIVDFGRQIADGMDYIGKNQIVHRDLAARNIVVAGDASEYILKITDFGLARETCDDGFYERVEGKEIPIKWTAPESLKNNIYTDRSDVWSYGIALWELCTLGGEPYAGYNNAEVMEKLRSGYRLQKPPSCNTDLYELMRNCWLENPDDRPDFKHILMQLTEYSHNPSEYCRIEDLYETDLNLTLRLQTLQQPNNHVHTPPSPSTPDSRPSPVREPGSRESCDGSRDHLHPPPHDNGTMASNPYTAEPCPSLPHNELV